MADPTPKPADQKASQEATGQGSAGRSKYVGRLLAYKWPVIGAIACLLVLGIGSYAYLSHQKRPEPSVLLAHALECLADRDNPEAIPEARKIASELDALHYRDPHFIGAVPYLLGITDFRRARLQTDRERLDSLRAAVAHLEQAMSVGMDAAHQVETDFALGISRSAIGDAVGAEQPLQRVVKISRGDDVPKPPPEFFEAAAALQESYLDQRGPSHLRQAIALNDVVLKKANLAPKERDQTLLCRAQIHVALHDGDQAQQALARVSAEAAARPGTTLIRAQVDIAEERFQDAQRELEPLAGKPSGLDSLYPRQALYLLGVCYEVQKDYENALRKYSDVVRGFADSQEGLAANVRRAELLRKAQRWEEALDAYVKALEMIRPTGFSNRWLRLDEFRAIVVAAWDDLKRTRAYEFAVELAKHMRPLFPPEEAYQAVERVATANQLLASQLESEIADRPFRVRQKRSAELLERWRTSGKAYADLAEALHESPRFPDVLWTSAEHYRQGHDFQDALVQMTRFINTQPRQRLPLAYVRRGEILMDLGRFDEALDHFERVLAEYPLDIASFPAMYLVGACEVERNHPDRAAQAWQRVLHEPHLDPSANEWQASLFALGRLQYQIALTMPAQPSGQSAQNSNSAETRLRPLAAYNCLDDAIRRLEEFVARYPKRPEAPEARFLLAKALRDRATLPRDQLKRAETDNARKELTSRIQSLLTDAENQLETLIDTLQAAESAGLLNPFEQRMVREAYFERGHNLYALEKYARAIEAYTNAANRYADDPGVLLAYIQMANCYDRLGKSIDARGVAIQAMLIHKNMSERAFTRDKTLMTRDEWRTWLEWAGALRRVPRRSEPVTAGPSTASSGPRAMAPGAVFPEAVSPNAERDPSVPKSS
jgi:tetratricopeptide (TPR) repeat protein